MKLLKFALPVLVLFFLTGCIEINEDIHIKKDGSGQLNVKMNMSQLLELMQNYMGKEEMDKQLPNRVMDTTVLIKNIVDTAQDISPEKKALVREGSVNMKLNMDQKLFKTNIQFPFKNLTSLQKLYTSLSDGSLGTDKLFKGLTAGKDTSSEKTAMPNINQFNSIYDFTVKDGLIARKVNAEKWKDAKDNPQLSQMKDVTNMGIEIPYTLTIELPRPVKKITSSMATVSPDKKTVVIKYNLVEAFDHPEKFEYSISY